MGPSTPCCRGSVYIPSISRFTTVADARRSAPGSEALTRLGRHLAALPLPPAAGKLLLYGVLLRCLDPLLTIACSLAYRWATLGAVLDVVSAK